MAEKRTFGQQIGDFLKGFQKKAFDYWFDVEGDAFVKSHPSYEGYEGLVNMTQEKLSRKGFNRAFLQIMDLEKRTGQKIENVIQPDVGAERYAYVLSQETPEAKEKAFLEQVISYDRELTESGKRMEAFKTYKQRIQMSESMKEVPVENCLLESEKFRLFEKFYDKNDEYRSLFNPLNVYSRTLMDEAERMHRDLTEGKACASIPMNMVSRYEFNEENNVLDIRIANREYLLTDVKIDKGTPIMVNSPDGDRKSVDTMFVNFNPKNMRLVGEDDKSIDTVSVFSDFANFMKDIRQGAIDKMNGKGLHAMNERMKIRAKDNEEAKEAGKNFNPFNGALR